MIDTILMDLDNTILDFDRGEAHALAYTMECLGAVPDPAVIKRYNAVNLSQWELLEKGEIGREELKVRRFRLLYEEFGLTLDPVKTAVLYEKQLEEEAYFMEGALELLQALKGRYRLYIVSNGTAAAQHNRLRIAGIRECFDDLFISEEIGFNKPSAEFFDYCKNHIPGYDPARTILVGDSLTSDIQGGRNAGIPTVWFHRPGRTAGSIVPDYEITQLGELLFLLKQL